MNPKRHIALFLLMIVSFKILVVPFVYLDFELRKDYIIQNLCENRFKPQLRCDGKCYLAKTLTKIAENKAENEAEKQEQSIKKVLEEVFDNQQVIAFSIVVFFVKIPFNFSYQSHPLADYAPALLRPPAFGL